MPNAEEIHNVPSDQLGRVVEEAAAPGATVIVVQNADGGFKVVKVVPD